MYLETEVESRPVDDPNPPEDASQPRRFPSITDRILAYAAVAASVLFVLWQLHPSLLLSNTTTAGGDTGAHFSVAYFYIHNILDHFRLTGWSSSWYDGYPLYVFYFPLPGIITAVLGFFVPYGVAFKLTTVCGVLTFPIAIYYFSRSMRLGYLMSAIGSIMSVGYLFDRSFTIDGGNIASTLAGEYSFSISLSLAFFALAVLLVNPAKTARRVFSGVLLAATLLAHILPAAFGISILFFLLLVRRNRAMLIGSVVAGLTMVGLAALWELPLIATYSYSTSMGWSRITQYGASLAPADLRVYLVLAVVGFLASLFMRIELGVLFGAVALSSIATFVYFPLKAVYNGRILPFYVLAIYLLAGIGILVIVEAVPALFGFARVLLGGIGDDVPTNGGIGAFLGWQDFTASKSENLMGSDVDGGPMNRLVGEFSRLRRRLLVRRRIAFVLTSLGMLTVVLVPLVNLPSWSPIKGSTSFVPGWIRWNYTGYEAKVGFPAYKTLMLEMKHIGSTDGCGRAMWEYNSNQNDYGTPMALMLLPYWTNNCVDSMEGLFFESSATTPYHFLNQSELSLAPSDAMAGLPYAGVNVALGVKHLQLLGVRYYMAFSPQIKTAANADPNLTLLATVAPTVVNSSVPVLAESWNIYRVRESSQVVALRQQPVVMQGIREKQASWLAPAIKYYQTPSEYPVARLAAGPTKFERVNPYQDVFSTSPEPNSVVSKLDVTNSTISFDVSRVGVPILVKTSYFPNWKADGASGPFRADPNLMVVIPTQKHVVLSYSRTSADWIGIAISFGTIGAIAGFWVFGRRRRSRAGQSGNSPIADETDIQGEPVEIP